MPRIARIAVPGLAYHVTHRGNHRQDVFFEAADRRLYKKWLREYGDRYGLAIWAYCLMSNHVHLLVVPEKPDSLSRTIGGTHGRYAQRTNRKKEWTGHLWANRYYSTPLDEEHLWAAVRYIELNPVRAGLVRRAEEYEWSSARAHATGKLDPILAASRPFPGHVRSWSEWLANDREGSSEQLEAIRSNTWTGRPTGSSKFVGKLEAELERSLTAPVMGRPLGTKKVVPVPTFSDRFAEEV